MIKCVVCPPSKCTRLNLNKTPQHRHFVSLSAGNTKFKYNTNSFIALPWCGGRICVLIWFVLPEVKSGPKTKEFNLQR